MTKASKLSRSKERNKTMSTLQMWQQQMAALQRASRPATSQSTTEAQEANNQEHFSSSAVVYPHLP